MPDEISSSAVTSVTLVTLSPSSRDSRRSVSPLSPSQTRDLRALNLFRAIGRRLGRRRIRHDNDDDDDVSQSSTDSEDRSIESTGGKINRSKKTSGGKKGSFLHRSASCNGYTSGLLHLHSTGSSAGSSSGSDISSGHSTNNNTSSPSSSLRQRSSFKNVFQSLTKISRSPSVSGVTTNSPSVDTSRRAHESDRKKVRDRSILRAPVTYTYVRGLSGLPTQRVPRGYPCVYLPSVVCCGTSKYGTQQPGLGQ
ncbi:putative protein TPRXL [Cryptotermes secundus]|uniref:putative protein TPRXL n=1 Tax=Cryptotermes secundus TaxID=105785 RepID=UPI000CD7C8CB|nr:putative protein TPRXL [Cryptotermes secundus]